MEQAEQAHILAAGTKIEEFTVQSVLGEGGFGITYLAYDNALKRKVAIKEYFPAEMTLRAADSITVNAKSNTKENYQFGLNKFLEEAQTLAQFTHPNIVQVTRFIKANNTAYLIMNFEQGEDLSDYLKRIDFKGDMSEAELKSYMLSILKGLHAVHKKGLLHRDVKPGNIYLRTDAEPMLIDFGAARYALGEHSKSMSAIISMGYAPPEQYSSKAKQNPASDLYAWGATAYQLITGKPPVESPDRSNAFFEGEDDPLTPLIQTHAGKYSKELLTTIDNCLQIANKNRPQSAVQVMSMLKGEKLKSDKTKIVNPEDRFKNTKPKQGPVSSSTPIGEPSSRKPQKSNTIKYILVSFLVAALGTGSYFGYDYYQTQQAQAELLRLADQKAKEEQKLAQEQAKKAEQLAWSQAEQDNTIASYQAYLDKYPTGENQRLANDKIKQLKAQHGNLITQAQKLLVKLGYQVPTKGKLEARTKVAIKDFEAKQNILVTGKADKVLLISLQIAYNKKDQAAWDLAQGNISKLQNYAKTYTDGQYINQVDSTIFNIRQAQQEAEAEQQRFANLAEEDRVRKQKQTEAEQQRLADLAEQERQLISSVQAELKRLKFKQLLVTGKLDNVTIYRIKQYQNYKKQNSTGKVSKELLIQLKLEMKLDKFPGDIFKDCSDCPEMVVIPSGSFQMGSNDSNFGKPIHIVNIKQFSMSASEVTFAQWDACYNDGGCSEKADDQGWGRGSRPVINVNWNDAQEYAKWLSQKTGKSYRLPSESEWEYAARAGSSTKYSWGNSINCTQARYDDWLKKCGFHLKTIWVKSYQANNFGLYDMHGNVKEWVADCWHDSYSVAPSNGMSWLKDCMDSTRHVTRGGSWFPDSNLSSAYRYWQTTSDRFQTLGFRLAKDK